MPATVVISGHVDRSMEGPSTGWPFPLDQSKGCVLVAGHLEKANVPESVALPSQRSEKHKQCQQSLEATILLAGYHDLTDAS